MSYAYKTIIEYETNFVCSNCGSKLKEKASFCPKCGNKTDRSVLLNNLKNEEVKIDRTIKQLETEQVEMGRMNDEKEKQLQKQIAKRQAELEGLKEKLGTGDTEIIPMYIKKIDIECEQLEVQCKENRERYSEKKKKLESTILKNSEELEVVRKNYRKLLEKVEMADLYCPVCGMFIGKRRYCGKCGYQMRKE